MTVKELLDSLKVNPKNPRTRSNAEQKRIKKSLTEFPEMLEKRPIVYDGNIVLGGNGRLTALKELVDEGIIKLKDSYFSDATNWTERQKREFVIKDNLLDSDWDDSILMDSWSDLPLEEWGVPVSWGEESDDDTYSKKVEAPIYEPSDKKPSISDLVDTEKADQLIAEIKSSDLPDSYKQFLIASAYRHYTFDYQKIADFYAHSDAQTQDLMEKSALVIIDFDKAIEYGFAEMTKSILDIQNEQQ